MLRRKRSIILVVITLLILAAFCSLAAAEDETGNEGQRIKTAAQTWVNPIYADIVTTSPPNGTMQAMSAPEPVSVATIDALRRALTQGFAPRETTISVVYTGAYTDLSSNDDGNLDQVDALLQSIFASDDYLYFNLQNWGYGGGGIDGEFQIDFTVAYMTTLEQENYVDTQVDAILANLIAPHMNDHQKVKAIHDYIVTHVAYNVSPSSGNSPHSAYTALHDGEAVCQGYALLAYKMLTEAGFEARIIGGNAGNDIDGWVAHAWNRVKLEDIWYNLDCTWDDPVPDFPGRVLYNYYHLTDTELAADHQRYAEYSSLPAASVSYFDTLNGKIRDSIDANDMDQTTLYLRLRQKLGLEYLLPENTAADTDELAGKILAAAQRQDTELNVRYFNGSTDRDTMVATIGQQIDDVSQQTNLASWSWNYSDFIRGGNVGYVLLEFDFTYIPANQAPTADPVTINGNPVVGESIREVTNMQMQRILRIPIMRWMAKHFASSNGIAERMKMAAARRPLPKLTCLSLSRVPAMSASICSLK
jgi:transglutaminase-like putative cysteine protease